MTKQEAVYWKNFIIRTIEDRLPFIEPSSEDAVRISNFAKQYMQTITGQQLLPQGIFREFLEIFGKIPAIQEDINRAQEQISVWLENLPYECSVGDVYAMFNEFHAPFRLDEDGYIVVTEMVHQDDEGYFVLQSPAVDLERYIEVVTF